MTILQRSMCTKVAFASEALAWKRLFEIALKGPRSEGKPVRCYRCPSCNAWHLTKA